MSVAGAKASMVLVRLVSVAVAAFAAAPLPWLAVIVDQMLAGRSLPYSNDGTIQFLAVPEAPPRTSDSNSWLCAPGVIAKVTCVGLSTVTLAMSSPVRVPSANQMAAESFTSVAVTGLPSDHLAPGWRLTVSAVPSG